MSLQIPCPQCGLNLKLPDGSFIGRKARCPKCGNRFVMKLPPAESPPPTRTASASAATPNARPVGVGSVERVEAICREFERLCETGKRPRIETFLGSQADVDRGTLLSELLALELETIIQRGEVPIIDNYLARFPDHADLVKSQFQVVVPSRHKPVEAESDPLPFVEFGQYRLIEKLGVGAMGDVFKAQHVSLGRIVAVKLLAVDRVRDTKVVDRFRREIKAVGQLDHPRIVRATDAGSHAGREFLVMELVDGVNLSRLIKRRGPLEVADACEIVRQAAEGLQHVHEHGLIHRDVKPSNLMLTHSGGIKILDLGLARLGQAVSSSSDEELTGSGQILGTVDYMAPEQALTSRSVDIRSDIYSLGCTLYHLLTGGAPFVGPEFVAVTQKLMAHVQTSPVPIRQRNEKVPAELERILDKMLAKEPDKRFATPADVVVALQPFCAGARLSVLAGSKNSDSEPAVVDSSISTDNSSHASFTVAAAPPEDPSHPKSKRKSVKSVARSPASSSRNVNSDLEQVAAMATVGSFSQSSRVSESESGLEFSPVIEDVPELGGMARLKKMHQRGARMRNITLAAVGLMLVGAAIAYAFVRNNSETAGTKKAKAGKNPAASAKNKGATTDADANSFGLGTDDISAANSDREPIELRAVPHGTAIAINLRPAELWQGSELASEVLACLGPIAVWAGGSDKDPGGIIKAYCLAEPAKIEELLVSVIPGARGTPPDYSFVVRLKQPFKKSDLIEKFAGELQQEPDKPPYYLGQERAYLILDTKTYACCPAKLANEMVENANGQSTTSDGLQAMLPETDRRRHFTIVFEPKDIQAHGEVLVPPNAQPLLRSFIEWISNDDEVETVAWSMHLGESFQSKLMLRNKKGLSTPPRLERAMQDKLKTMPRDILASVEQMDPQEIGKRKVIGRFPAMTKVFALSTRLSKGERLVAMNTTLPERAAPNLALAGLLAWNETTLPTYGKKPTTVASTASAGGNVSVAERLKKKISVDFRRRPLVDAFNDIGEEIGVTFKMDGDAIKAVGATQNIPQEFKMDDVPATVVIEKIFAGRDRNLGLILVVDEKTRTATVTNPDSAVQRGEKAFPLK